MNSEQFANAAYALARAIEKMPQLDCTELRQCFNQFEESVQMMKRSVSVLAEIKAMDQANMDRARQDKAPAYGEEHYMKVIDQL